MKRIARCRKKVIVIIVLALSWAIGYILMAHPGDEAQWGDNRTKADLMAHSGASTGPVDGAQIYAAQCVACHQASGAGLPGVFPPLAGSEWVLAKESLPVNILLHGISGKLTVKGTAYTGTMPAFKDKLSDAEIAAVLTFVRANFWQQGRPDCGGLGADRTASGQGEDIAMERRR
ncbi:c-type cytochrome [Undibacterium arcticum]